MKVTKAGKQLAQELKLNFPQAEAFCSLLKRHADSYTRIQEVWCSVDVSDYQKQYLEGREKRLEKRIVELVDKWLPGTKVRFTGDPRGFCVKLLLPDERYNTWGGKEEGWGVG